MKYDSLILICAFRYALGRRTYVVNTVCREILNNWYSIPPSDRELIVREILEHREKFHTLGDQCDERDWMRIVTLASEDAVSNKE